MTSDSPPPETLESATKRIARLERRLERERTAREEAEVIADRGMRELWLANRELDERVAERTAALESALAELEASTTAGSAFISMLSHEMLTPLNGVIGMLELLEDLAYDDKNRAYVQTALESSDRLGTLLSRLLDLVELRSGQLAVAPVFTSLSRIADDLTARWQLKAMKSQHLLSIHIDSDRHAMVAVDERRVHQIIDELLRNAFVHGEPGVVEVALRIEPGERFVATVLDSGPGFELSEGDFWSTFARLDMSPDRATEGAGIGLGLADQLAKALGGSLSIETAPGAPTRGVLDIPVESSSTV